MSDLFTPIRLGALEVASRAFVAPMCQYSCDPAAPGVPTDWHLVHYGAFAVGGAPLVITEATAVSPEGRISPQDAGIWDDAQAERWARVTRFLHARGTLAGVQLAHAGRKASTHAPFATSRGSVAVADGGWQTLAPSAVAFPGYDDPAELDEDGIAGVVADFAAAARRADAAGFDVVELHAAHGYLLHQFLSPLSNHRDDAWGGPFEHRVRLVLEVVDAVRAVWPERKGLLVRVSATDWTDGGWDGDDTVALASLLAARGVHLLDVSTGGNTGGSSGRSGSSGSAGPAAVGIPVGPGYQVPFATRVRTEAGLPAAAVGLITAPRQADQIITAGLADAVLLGREALRDPRWWQRAAAELGHPVRFPDQYARAGAAAR